MQKILLCLIVLLLPACYYDKEELLYAGETCEIAEPVSFSGDVFPIINSRCNNCHSGNTPSAGISLANYAEVMKVVDSGKLLGAIQWLPGFSAMPKNSGKMPACEVNKIKKWIDQGSANN